jgi:hypothetical protein
MKLSARVEVALIHIDIRRRKCYDHASGRRELDGLFSCMLCVGTQQLLHYR